MRRALAIFTGSGIATVTTASALAALTALTLVAGGLVVTRVMDPGGDRSVVAAPVIGEPLGPIVVGSSGRHERASIGVGPKAPVAPTARPNEPASAPSRVASLVDVDRVSGAVSTALDPQEPGRMEEVGTIERIESIIGDTTTEDDGSGGSDQTEPPSDDPDDRTVLAKVVPAVEGTVAATEEGSIAEENSGYELLTDA